MNAVINTTTEDHSLTLAAVLRHVELVEHVLSKVMKKGTHYGESFPGDKKMNLLKPGADKLCLAFQLSPTFEIDERALVGEHREYRVTCKLTTASGRVMGEGVGTCSTMEKKYRWRNAKAKCPECQKETVIKTQRGYWCPQDKGGCGCNPSAPAIENQVRGQVENTDIADVFNTCLKIGKKRAYVDATITATAASDLFTQDIEDLQSTAEMEERKEAAKQAAAHPQEEHREAPKVPPAATRPASTPAASATTGSANAQAASGSVGRVECERVYPDLKALIGAKPAGLVWAYFKTDHTARMINFNSIIAACREILKIVGEQRGGEIISECVDYYGNDQMKDVGAFISAIVRLSNGEVVEREATTVGAEKPRAGAPGIGDEEPPF